MLMSVDGDDLSVKELYSLSKEKTNVIDNALEELEKFDYVTLEK